MITIGLGTGFVLESMVTLTRLLRRARRAVERGYEWKTVAHVACDALRDTGFLLQGVRWYTSLEPRTRERVANLRIVGAVLQLISALWLATGFSMALLLAARGVLTPTSVIVFTLLPAAGCLFLGIVARSMERALVRRAKRDWFQQPWAEQLAVSEVESWQEAFAEFREADTPREKSLQSARMLRLSAIAVAALGVLALLPPFALAPTSAVGPIMASVAVPRFTQILERAARVEAFRPYRLSPGSDVTPVLAGQLLQTLLFVGRSDAPASGEVAPIQRYFQPWFPGPASATGGPTGIDPRTWGRDLLPSAAHLSPEVLEYLKVVAAHEAHGDFSRLATAAHLDVLPGRWTLPFEDVGMATLPVSRFNHVRLGAQAHVGKAVHELAHGDVSAAESTIREVITVGFLMVDDGPTIIDNLLGFGLINLGADALETFLETTGRDTDLAALRQVREAATRASKVQVRGQALNLESVLAQLPEMAANPATLRGLRWDLFTLTNTLTPCINLNRVVFGPDSTYGDWLERVRVSLVQWPSEEALFDLSLDGYFGAPTQSDRSTLLARVLGITMGGSDTPGSCKEIFRRLSTGR